MSESPEKSRDVRTRWLLIGAVAALLVVVAVLVVLLVRRGSSSDTTGPAAMATAVETVSLDGVVAGEGALRDSQYVPGIRVGYEATCVGAGQAAAGWTADLFAGATTANAADADALESLLTGEVLAPTYQSGSSDPVRDLRHIAPRYLSEEEAGGADPVPVNELHAEYGAFRLLSCNAGSDAEVEIYAPLRSNGWRADTPRMTSGAVEQLIVYRYTLTAVDGEWRVQTALDVTEEANQYRTGELDFLAPYWQELVDPESDGTMNTAGQDILMSVLGDGSHRYTNE